MGALIRQAGLQLIELLMEEEVREVVGERSQPQPDRTADQWGKERCYCVVIGQKVRIERPRVRSRDDQEVRLMVHTTFALRGKTFRLHKDDFVKATKGLKPGPVQKYSVVVDGKRYPIRQVLAAVTKLPAIAITSQDAYRVLEQFGFAVDTKE